MVISPIFENARSLRTSSVRGKHVDTSVVFYTNVCSFFLVLGEVASSLRPPSRKSVIVLRYT